MLEAIIGVGGTVLGTLLGYWLSESSQNKKQAEEEKKQAKSVRMMIELEIDQNLGLLKILIDNIKKEKTDGDQDFQNAQKLLHTPFPTWNHSFFQSQLASIPKALSSNELQKVYSHYNDLNKLSEIRLLLNELQDKQTQSFATLNSANSGIFRYLFMPQLSFSKNAGMIWGEFSKITDNLLEDGNILKTYNK